MDILYCVSLFPELRPSDVTGRTASTHADESEAVAEAIRRSEERKGIVYLNEAEIRQQDGRIVARHRLARAFGYHPDTDD